MKRSIKFDLGTSLSKVIFVTKCLKETALEGTKVSTISLDQLFSDVYKKEK